MFLGEGGVLDDARALVVHDELQHRFGPFGCNVEAVQVDPVAFVELDQLDQVVLYALNVATWGMRYRLSM